MSKVGFCQNDAGVLYGDKLSKIAKASFIKDVKDQLIYGTAGLPPFLMPCGGEIPAVPFANTIQLEDERQYPDFHKNWLGTFEQIALALDIQSQFMFLPIIMDPIALAVKLQLDVPALNFPDDFILYGLAIPLLAIKLGFDLPVDLIAKFPDILIPAPPIPKVPLPVDVDIELFPDLFLHLAWPLKLPKLFADLIIQMPSLFLGILQLDLKPICDLVLNAGLFGDLGNPGNFVQLAAAKVLARKTAECILIAMVGGSVGSSSGGIVGAMGRKFGYVPPPPPAIFEKDPRDRIVSAALKLDGKSWSSDNQLLSSEGSFNISLPYTEWILPIMTNGSVDKKKDAFQKAQKFSSCGLFIRGCYFRGGATDAYFTKEYRDTTAISGLLDVAQKKDAFIQFSVSNMPALKKGDAILVQTPGEPGTEHVLMLTSNYAGGFDGSVSGIEGGQSDPDNDNRPTLIKSTNYHFFKKNGAIHAGKDSGSSRQILKIFNAEKMVQNV